MNPTRRQQPFRQSAQRAPSPVLDAMRAGMAGANPGAGSMLMAASKKARKGGRPRKTQRAPLNVPPQFLR